MHAICPCGLLTLWLGALSDTLVCQSHGLLRFLEIHLGGQHWSESPHSQSSANTYSSRANQLPAHGSFEYLNVPEIAISTEVPITTNLMGDCNTSAYAVIKCLLCKGTWSACWSVWEGLRNTPCLKTALQKIYISLHLWLILLFLMQFRESIPGELHKQALLSCKILFMSCRTLFQLSFLNACRLWIQSSLNWKKTTLNKIINATLCFAPIFHELNSKI